MKAHLEIHWGGRWRLAACLESSGDDSNKGHLGPTRLEYDQRYLADCFQAGVITGATALSVRFPAQSESDGPQPHWPPFMLDILPSGHARRFWLGRVDDEDLPDDLTLPSDWPLLLAGGCNPPGNIRVREAAMALDAPTVHPGFSYQDVVEKQQQFIEYAEHAGIPVAGSSGAPGDAPKYLLVRDKNNRWHPDGAIPEAEIRDHWLVKFPHRDERGGGRGVEVLRNELAYMRVAHAVGLLAEELVPDWDDNMLFVPRFDRVVTEGGVVRLGFESLLSACGIADYGIDRRHESFCRAIARHSSNPNVDLLEYVQRDILNFAMRNTDNHGRNQALLKFPDGGVRLSPLYDFAPMFYDSRGISRRTRWRRERETPGSSPDWGGIIDDLSTELGCDREGLCFSLAEWSTEIQRLPETMKDSGVDDGIVEHCVRRIQDVSMALDELGRRLFGILQSCLDEGLHALTGCVSP